MKKWNDGGYIWIQEPIKPLLLIIALLIAFAAKSQTKTYSFASNGGAVVVLATENGKTLPTVYSKNLPVLATVNPTSNMITLQGASGTTSFLASQVTDIGGVSQTGNTAESVATSVISLFSPSGGSGGGGTSDATAANQVTEIARLTAMRDSVTQLLTLERAKITVLDKPKCSQNSTDVTVPASFTEGYVEWANIGTGTVTVTLAGGGTWVLSSASPSLVWDAISGVKRGGITIAVTGGALISKCFN
jgi:hypothetical protein